MYYDDMSIELAQRPDLNPAVLKGSNVEAATKPEEVKENGNVDGGPTPTKKKVEKDDKMDRLIVVAENLQSGLAEAQKIEQDRNDMFRELIGILKQNNSK